MQNVKWRDGSANRKSVCVCESLSRVWLFVTPCTVACQVSHSWDFLGKNTGVGCHLLLQRISLTRGSNHVSCTGQMDSLPLSHQGSPQGGESALLSWHSVQFGVFTMEWRSGRNKRLLDLPPRSSSLIINPWYSDIYYTWSDYVKDTIFSSEDLCLVTS